jgi:hypothetical protein
MGVKVDPHKKFGCTHSILLGSSLEMSILTVFSQMAQHLSCGAAVGGCNSAELAKVGIIAFFY